MRGEDDRAREETEEVYFKRYTQHSRGGTEEYQEKTQFAWSPSRQPTPGPPKHLVCLLTTQPQYSVG